MAAHVEQGDHADHRVEQVRPLCEHDAHQQAAVGATHDAEVLGRSDLAFDEVLRHGDEVVVSPLAVLFEGRLCQRGRTRRRRGC
jgi:hypothetical protein